MTAPAVRLLRPGRRAGAGAGAGGGRVRIETMAPRHLDGVLRIERQVYPRPWSPAVFRGELDRPDRAYLVATTGPSARLRDVARRRRTVVGYAGVLVGAGEAHVLTVAVDPRARRRHVATRLVLELLAAAVALGADAATLEVRESNAGAQALYRRLGFASEGVRPGYYEDDGEGAHIMWLRDLRAPATVARIRAEADRVGHPRPRVFA